MEINHSSDIVLLNHFGYQVLWCLTQKNKNCESDSDIKGPLDAETEHEFVTPVEEDHNDDENVELPVTDVGEVDRVMFSCESVCVGTVSSDRDDELTKIRAFCCKGCKLNNEEPCFLSFDEDFVYDIHLSMASLCEYEKDLVLLGKLSCHFHNSKKTICSKKKVQQERQHQRTENYVNGRRVCRGTFKFLNW